MDTSPIRVLLVDDDHDDYVILRDLFLEIEAGKFRLEWVETYDPALEQMVRNEHDVYLIDYLLGERNGLELLKEAVKKNCKGPIILLSGKGAREVDMAAMKAGASDYLDKGEVGSSLLERSIRYAIERKRAEEALRESEERYHMLLEASPDPVVAYDMEGKGTYLNPAFTRVFGWLPEELLGKKLDYVPDENWPETQMMIDLVQAGQSFSGVESRRYTKDGSILDVSISAAIHLNPDGIPMGSVHILRDITDHKLAEEALRKAHNELEERVKDRTAELAKTNEELLEYDHIVAHVLKAPLRAIHFYSDFLREDLEGNLNGDQKNYVDSLTRTVREAAGLVDDLLEFSMVGRRSGPIETIDIGAFLKELISSLDLPSDVEVVMRNEWPTIEAEPALVQGIFLHLIRNAVKFNRSPRKCIEIGWLPAGDEHYKLFVRDNGIGIEPRYHGQIFHVFQRLYPEEYEGAGVGLAICKKIAQRHGGRIWVESELGKGSTFYFTISSAG